MELPINYIADHYTILKVKKEEGLEVDAELKVFEKEIYKINPDLIEELYKVNKEMWPIHDEIVNPNTSSERIVKLAKELLQLNGERVEFRSQVARQFGEFEEHKTYYR